MINTFTREEYHSYINDPMRFYDDPDEMTEIYLSDYLEEVLAAEHPGLSVSDLTLEYALEDSTKRYEHIALSYGVPYVMIVLVTDKQQILGHFLLDLNEEYGLKN